MRALWLLAASVALLLGGAAPDRALAQAPAAADQSEPKDRPISVPRRPVAYETWQSRILFKMMVGDREVLALLDTGMPTSLIDMKVAKALGLSLTPDTVTLQSVNGARSTLWRTNEVSLTIPGQFKLNASAFRADDLAGHSAQIGRDIQFIFGADFLQNMALLIDPGLSELQLVPSGIGIGAPDADLLELKGPWPTATILAGGQSIPVTLDTGANFDLCVAPALWEAMSPQFIATTKGTVTDPSGIVREARNAKLGGAVLGKTTLPVIEVCEHDLQGSPNPGVLGNGVLSRFRVAMDVRAGKLWLLPRRPNAPPKAP